MDISGLCRKNDDDYHERRYFIESNTSDCDLSQSFFRAPFV